MLIFFLCLVFFQEKVNLLGNINKKQIGFSPSAEFIEYDVQLSNSSYFLQDTLCLLIGKKDTADVIKYYELRFVSIQLDELHRNALINSHLYKMIAADSIRCSLDSTRVFRRKIL